MKLFYGSHIFLIAAFSLAVFAGCGGKAPRGFSTASADTLYRNSSAGRFVLYSYGGKGSSVLEIKDPWQGAEGVSKFVFLSRGGEEAPEGFDAETISVPIKSAVCMSTSYIGFIDALGSGEVIKGVSGTGFVTSPGIVRRIDSGLVAEVGHDTGMDYERLVALDPDVIFIFGVTGENSAVTGKLKELGLKVVYIGEYLEESPLGRAEWIIPFGEFLGKRTEAEDIFAGINREYNEAMEVVRSSGGKAPTVMLNSPWRDSWFVPGDRSYMVRLLEDAGGAYACSGFDSDQSRPISIETAFIKASGSDIWLNPGSAVSLADVVAMNLRFSGVPAVKNGRVFNNNKRTTPAGGSDFWESGTVNPHIILRDLIKIMHPELLPEHEFYYFRQLE